MNDFTFDAFFFLSLIIKSGLSLLYIFIVLIMIKKLFFTKKNN